MKSHLQALHLNLILHQNRGICTKITSCYKRNNTLAERFGSYLKDTAKKVPGLTPAPQTHRR
jgi:hypothetical protein